MFRPLLVALFASAALLLTTVSGSGAMSPEEQARRATVVAHIGTTTVTVGQLEDRLAQVPRFQLHAFGDTADEIRHKFFDQILLPEILYASEAEKRHLGDELPTSTKLERAESGAAVRVIRKSVRPETDIKPDEIRKYYEDNKGNFDTPERLFLFRILVTTKEEAADVLEAAKKDGTLEGFTKLAKDHSIDKATALRAGNLGYIAPDGTSSEAGLAVDPTIVRAAEHVKDGEFVPVPIREGQNYAVVWRRGTVPPMHRSVEQAAAQIRELIWKKEIDGAVKKHIDGLRAAHLSELNESLVNGIDIRREGDVVTRGRTGEVAPFMAGGRGAPHTVN